MFNTARFTLLTLALVGMGCNHRIPVMGDEQDSQALDLGLFYDTFTPPDAMPPLPDLMLPDGPLPDLIGPSSPCKDKSATNPNGRNKVTYHQNLAGDWQVAVENNAGYGMISLPGATSKEAAAHIDHPQQDEELAGFVLSKGSTKAKIQDEWTALQSAIIGRITAAGGKVLVRASGTQLPSHDLYPQVQGSVLDITLLKNSNVASLRDDLLGALLSRQSWEMGPLPKPYGEQNTQLVLRFATLKRYELKLDPKTKAPLKDASGYGQDTGNKSKWRLVVMGAVARKVTYDDPKRKTSFIVDDLSNGTALATHAAKLSDGCATETIKDVPQVDIIWVMDESGSMSDNRQDIVSHANNFFNRVQASGVDFRVAVTNVCNPKGNYPKAVGKFCSAASSDLTHDGGVDRFLKPSEKSLFSSCIINPPGLVKSQEYGLVNAREAVLRHLPRATNLPHKIRKEAKLVIIVATDEYPNSISSILGTGVINYCTPDNFIRSELDKAVEPYIKLFSGQSNPEAKAMFHVIGGVCKNHCGALVGHGYIDVAQQLGGQVGDVCQKNLGQTLNIIMDHIVGTVSPVKLKHVPISATLAVSINGISTLRSRTYGYQYQAATNSLAFINIKYKKGTQVMVGYKRYY